jgi:hypothetical protein
MALLLKLLLDDAMGNSTAKNVHKRLFYDFINDNRALH